MLLNQMIKKSTAEDSETLSSSTGVSKNQPKIEDSSEEGEITEDKDKSLLSSSSSAVTKGDSKIVEDTPKDNVSKSEVDGESKEKDVEKLTNVKEEQKEPESGDDLKKAS